ncbi:MAG: efflux transporter outer membrane subunit [Paramuribaculum sp.]|nr:efflux transporter outer membrane subunit [Paramuribaculum sp.]
MKKDAFLDSIPKEWEYSSKYKQEFPTDDDWWKIFGDELLDSLIAEGEANNFNLLQAARRIEMSRQALRKARSPYYPQFSLDAGWSKSRESGSLYKSRTNPTTMSYFSAGIDMSWEIDVFGKIRSNVKEAKANVNASRADYASVSISLCAEIASSYVQLRMLQEELSVNEEHVKSQEQVLNITEARFETGLASMLDVAQAKTVYYSTLATISSLKSQITTTINSIAVLVGEYPENMRARLSVARPQLAPNQPVYVGIPMDLIRRRPDVVEAEYELASYAAALGVAKKDFLPTISLTGSIGTSAHNISDVVKNNSFTYSIAPTLSWTIFSGFARSAEVASAKEQMLAGIDNYNLTLLTAIEEVDNAMATYFEAQVYQKRIEEVLVNAQLAFDLALDRYKQGLDAFINVADAQITLLQYATELVEAKGDALTALISLYKALGGGWNIDKL